MMGNTMKEAIGKYHLSLEEISDGVSIQITASSGHEFSADEQDLFKFLKFFLQETTRSYDREEFLDSIRLMVLMDGDQLGLLNQILHANAWGLFRKMFVPETKPLTLTEQLNQSVYVLPLSRRLRDVFYGSDIHLIGELVQKTRRELLKLRWMGPRTLRDLEVMLADVGLRIEMTQVEIENWVYPNPLRDE